MLNKNLKIKESDIQSSICCYLEWKKYFFWRQNNVAPVQVMRDGSLAMRRMPKYSRKGTPDIVVLVPGKVIFLEVKTFQGVLSQEQKELQKVCKDFEIEYYVVRSLEEVQEIGL